MSSKTVTPSEIAEAATLREAGFTVLAISQRLGVPVRTLQRHFSKNGVVKGSVSRELLDSAREELLRQVTSEESIRMQAARLIADDLAHASHLREIVLSASERLEAPATLKEAALVMRAAAAYATAIKATSDTIRHCLRLDKLSEQHVADLPELVISELSAEDVAKLRKAQKEEVDAR